MPLRVQVPGLAAGATLCRPSGPIHSHVLTAGATFFRASGPLGNTPFSRCLHSIAAPRLEAASYFCQTKLPLTKGLYGGFIGFERTRNNKNSNRLKGKTMRGLCIAAAAL